MVGAVAFPSRDIHGR